MVFKVVSWFSSYFKGFQWCFAIFRDFWLVFMDFQGSLTSQYVMFFCWFFSWYFDGFSRFLVKYFM